MANVYCQLWMGSLEPYMTENFIIAAFRKMGEDPQNVRLMRNKYTGEPAGYCFVNFSSDDKAIDAMHKLNGKPIPGTNPIVRFRLNSASNSYKVTGNEREFSVWVGDLSSDVDDYSLYKVFSTKYSSIKTAKVILDSSGFSKGYGFVKFGIEDEQQAALYDMNGYIGLGTKPLKICNAVPKPKDGTEGSSGTPGTAPAYITSGYGTAATSALAAPQATDYSQYYDPSMYWQNFATSWQGYYDQTNGVADPNAAYYTTQTQQAALHSHSVAQQAEAWAQQYHKYTEQQQHHHSQPDEDMQLVEHKVPVNTDKLNREVAERDRNFWDAVESSKWLPIEQLEVF